MTENADLIIVGGGLNGAALSLACAQSGLRSIVVDSLPAEMRADTGFDGRAYALALASRRMLGALGVWEPLKEKAQPILEIVASDGRAGEGPAPFFLHFDHAEIEEGPMGFMVEDRHLRPALLAKMEADDRIDHRPNETVVDQSQDGHAAVVTLASGTTLRAPLLVGADGRRSGTAQRAGIGRDRTDYGQTALVCAVAHERPHDGVAHQFFMPGGPLAILPLKGNRVSIVWSEARHRAETLAIADEATFLAALKPAFGDFLGEISLDGRRWSYPLDLTLAKQITGDRLVLVGDAAQGVHPIAGQGLNQGLRDVGTLAEVLADARRRGEDIGGPLVLERHRRWRSFDRTTLTLATHGFNALFSNDNPALRLGRDLGMGVVQAFPGLRRRFIREAAGLSGDLPRLLRGLPA